ncbi:nucleotide-diphospho-sugar transferase [Circinella umbellata]|nr:nucleotide-diphospho-sugar transferase [Circinella umbellata]
MRFQYNSIMQLSSTTKYIQNHCLKYYPKRILRWTLIVLLLLVFLSILTLLLDNTYTSSSLPLSSYMNLGGDTTSIFEKLYMTKPNTVVTNNNNDPFHSPRLEHEMVNHLFGQEEIDDWHDPKITWIDDHVWEHVPVKGVLYMFLRNEDLQHARSTIRSIEDRFNHNVGYPWVILSNHYLSPSFKKYLTKVVTKGRVFFGRVDRETWNYPNWVPTSQVEKAVKKMMTMDRIPEGVRPSYQFSSRYHAGLFFHHPLMQNADYSWRVEPSAYYSCEMEDPFLKMKTLNKTLGFVMTSYEEKMAVRSLWSVTRAFREQFFDQIRPLNETIMPWLLDDSEYNFCHIWSNFMILDLTFLRSEHYQAYFRFLDYSGGFFYESWSDGAVITLAAAMYLKREELYFFNEIGYEYRFGVHCPLSLTDYYPRCSCDVELTTDFNRDSCTISMLQYVDKHRIQDIATFARRHFMIGDRSTSLLSGF